MIKKTLALSAVTLALLSTTAFAQNLAVVNGKAIPTSQSDAIVKQLVSNGEKDTPELRQSVKARLVQREVLAQEAEKQNVISSSELNNHLEFAKKDILITSLRASYLKKNPVSDKEIKAAYDFYVKENAKQYHAKHILVKSEAEATGIISQLNKGGNFEKLAKEKSIDQGSAANGGDLGWAPPSAYIQPFSQAMVGLNKGQVTSSPVKTPFGYHVIKLIDTRKPTMPTYEQAKPRFKSMLEEKKWVAYENSLIKQAKIQ